MLNDILLNSVASIPLDFDSWQLGQRMKEEINDRLAMNWRLDLKQIEKQNLQNGKFVFGKCSQEIPSTSVFKIKGHWYVYAVQIDVRRLVKEVSGPYTYEQAVALLFDRYIGFPIVINKTNNYMHNLFKFTDLNNLARYLVR